jgi:6-phosphogluconate dehydrogenase
MVQNGIEYRMMAAYAEGLGILRGANIGKQRGENNAETTPLRQPKLYQFEFNLADIAEVWRRGSVIASWLLDFRRAPRNRGAWPGVGQPQAVGRDDPRSC